MIAALLVAALAAVAPWPERCRAHEALLTQLAARLDAGDEEASGLLVREAQEADRDLSSALLAEVKPGPDLASRSRLAARALGSACQVAASQPSVVDPTRMAEILSRPEFDRLRTGPSWAARLTAAILAAIGQFMASDTAADAALYMRPAILLAVALLVLYLGLRLSRTRRPPARSGRASLQPGVVHLDEPAVHRTRGDEALARGLFRDAIREHLLAVLSALERAGLLRPGRSRTNRECAFDLASRGASGPLVRSFTGLTERYDRAFYGKPDLERAEALSLIEALEAIEGLVGE